MQRYQRLGGTITVGGKTQPLLGAWMDGDKLGFSFVDGENTLQTVRMTAVGIEHGGHAVRSSPDRGHRQQALNDRRQLTLP